MDKEFVFDGLVDEANLLNQKQAISDIFSYIKDKKKIVLYGSRNRAKTSIIRNIIFPKWKKQNPKGLAIYIELMHVKDLADISERFTKSFNQSYGELAKIKTFLDTTIKLFKGLRPSYELGENGKMEFSIKSSDGKNIVDIEELLDRIHDLSEKGVPCLLCFDEFQDIAFVKKAEAILRRKFEDIGSKIPIIVLGSKQHVLTEVFEKPKAPFYKWGVKIEISNIPYEEYYPYLKERFIGELVNTSDEVLKYLQDALFRSPEEIHRIGYEANRKCSSMPLTEGIIDGLIDQYIEGNGTVFESRVDHITSQQLSFLKQIVFSRDRKVSGIYSQDFLHKVGVSSPGMQKIVKRLLDRGFIDRKGDSYTMNDPFLFYHLKKTRLS